MWIASKVAKGVNDSGRSVYVQVVYSSDGTDKLATVGKFQEVYTTSVIRSDWPDSIIRSRLTDLNGPAVDISVITLGPPLDAPVIQKPIPTPEEQARQDWLDSLKAWKVAKVEVEMGLGKTSQSDVDTALATVQKNYLPAYSVYLVGV